MSNIVPNNMSSVLTNSSDFLELPFLPPFDDGGLPDFYLNSPYIEAVSLPTINPSRSNVEFCPDMEPTANSDNNYTDISNSITNRLIHLEIQNTLQTTIQINLNSTNQINESNQNDSNGVIVNSNANIIKFMQAKKDLEELEVINQRLENEHHQLTKENDEIKQEIIEYVKRNKIQFDPNVIKSSMKRKKSSASFTLTSISSPVPSTSTCSFDNPKRFRGRPHKDLKEAEEELEKIRPKLNAKELRVASNNVASIKARENKKKLIQDLCTEEQNLIELNKNLTKKYKRNEKDILRIIKAAIRSAKKL